MTGEITLRGRVLPIGGLKEKLLAAKVAKIKTVVVPVKNRKDVEEMESEIYEGMEIVYAESMDEVLKTALAHMPEKPKDEPKVEPEAGTDEGPAAAAAENREK